MPRTAKNPRNTTVAIRTSQSGKDKIKNRADELGMTMSEYIISLVKQDMLKAKKEEGKTGSYES